MGRSPRQGDLCEFEKLLKCCLHQRAVFVPCGSICLSPDWGETLGFADPRVRGSKHFNRKE